MSWCKAHGGGKRCEEPGCGKSARDSTCRCEAHGGGIASLSSFSFFLSGRGGGRSKRNERGIRGDVTNENDTSGSSSSSSSSDNLSCGYGDVNAEATSTPGNEAKQAMSEIADNSGGRRSKKKSRASLDGGAATSVSTSSISSRPEVKLVSYEATARGGGGRRPRSHMPAAAAAVVAVEPGGGDNAQHCTRDVGRWL